MLPFAATERLGDCACKNLVRRNEAGLLGKARTGRGRNTIHTGFSHAENMDTIFLQNEGVTSILFYIL